MGSPEFKASLCISKLKNKQTKKPAPFHQLTYFFSLLRYKTHPHVYLSTTRRHIRQADCPISTLPIHIKPL